MMMFLAWLQGGGWKEGSQNAAFFCPADVDIHACVKIASKTSRLKPQSQTQTPIPTPHPNHKPQTTNHKPQATSHKPQAVVEENFKSSQRPKEFKQNNFAVSSIHGYVIKKNSSRGAKHGPSERQRMYYKAKKMLQKARQEEHGSHSSIPAQCSLAELLWRINHTSRQS